jgi:hypothetical protein
MNSHLWIACFAADVFAILTIGTTEPIGRRKNFFLAIAQRKVGHVPIRVAWSDSIGTLCWTFPTMEFVERSDHWTINDAKTFYATGREAGRWRFP